MKAFYQHPVYGEIVYTENIWTGKRTLSVNGDMQKVPKKEFLVDGKKAMVKGRFQTGVNLVIDGETVALLPKPKWYETVLALLPLLFLLSWGNSPALCSIFPVVGGALGGALGGLASVASLLLMRKTKSPAAKVLIGTGIFTVTILIAFLLALVILLASTL